MTRKSEVKRKTKETNISVSLDLDGKGDYKIETGLPFLNHMLELLSKHSFIDINLQAKGDLAVDAHHTVEDTGIALGEALKKALGDKKNITRYGWAVVPMDESLAMASLDLSGRSYFDFEFYPGSTTSLNEKAGELEISLFEEFFKAFVDNADCTLHLKILAGGSSTHHKMEALFKALAKALSMAVSSEERSGIPSTKGKL